MKTLLLKLLHLVFGIAIDTATESANTVKSTLRLWYYFSILLVISFVLAIVLLFIFLLFF